MKSFLKKVGEIECNICCYRYNLKIPRFLYVCALQHTPVESRKSFCNSHSSKIPTIMIKKKCSREGINAMAAYLDIGHALCHDFQFLGTHNLLAYAHYTRDFSLTMPYRLLPSDSRLRWPGRNTILHFGRFKDIVDRVRVVISIIGSSGFLRMRPNFDRFHRFPALVRVW